MSARKKKRKVEEPIHENGYLHLHGSVADPVMSNDEDVREFVQIFRKEFGYTQHERVHQETNVGYVAGNHIAVMYSVSLRHFDLHTRGIR